MTDRAAPGSRSSEFMWLPDVPAAWDVKRLKFCAKLVNQKIDGRASELPYFGLEHVESWTGKQVALNGEMTSDAQCSRFRPGDVLFGKLRPYLAKALRAFEHGICTGELIVLRPVSLTQDFLFYCMLTPDFITVVDSSTYGAKMPRASWDFMGNLPMPVPSEGQQDAIAAFLDRETARIDALIEKKQRQTELLHEKRAALISHAVTKGLDPSARMRDSGIDWLGEVPRRWSVAELRRVAASLQTGPFGSQLHASDYVDGGIPIVNPANIQGGAIVPDSRCTVDEEVFARLGRHELQEGDIVLGRRGEMGRCALVARAASGFLCGTGCIRVRLNRSAVYPEFVALFLRHPGVRGHLLLESVGSTMDNLNTAIIGRIPIAIPPLQEQACIYERLQSDCEKIDRLIARVGSSMHRLREYRTGLISAAVTGKIDVRQEVA